MNEIEIENVRILPGPPSTDLTTHISRLWTSVQLLLITGRYGHVVPSPAKILFQD